MKNKRPLYEVARAAKVSPATVSRVAAGNPSVSPEVRLRVQQAALNLGIDFEIRRSEKNRTLAFLLGNRDVLHSFQSRILLGAETYCSAQNWELLFLSFRYSAALSPEALHLPEILSRGTSVRGVIVGGTNSPNLLKVLSDHGIPFAVLGNNVTGEWEPQKYDTVYSDDIQGATDATRHLISLGHKNIHYIGNLHLPWFARCAEGYRKAMVDSNLAPQILDIRSDGQELGYLATKSIFKGGQTIEALLAGTDQVATGVYAALRESKLAIPGDISVVGFNDTDAALLYPALTSVREFPEELGRHLAEFVLNRTRNPLLSPQSISIPTQFVLRDSIRAPSARDSSVSRKTETVFVSTLPSSVSQNG